MFRLFTFTCFVLCCLSVNSQTVTNVHLIGFRDYFIDVCAEVFKTLQETHFHTFRLPDFTQEINATVLGQHVKGHAVYSNAFVVSIDGVDVLQSGLLQRWVSPNATTASVSVEGVMRLRNVKMGFDVDANLNDQSRRSTGSITFPLLHFGYVIHKDLFTDDLTATITTVVQTTPTRMVMYPADNVTDIISSTYVVTSFNAGALLWGPEIVEPIAQRVIHEVPFPQICYNCPAT